MASPDAA